MVATAGHYDTRSCWFLDGDGQFISTGTVYLPVVLKRYEKRSSRLEKNCRYCCYSGDKIFLIPVLLDSDNSRRTFVSASYSEKATSGSKCLA